MKIFLDNEEKEALHVVSSAALEPYPLGAALGLFVLADSGATG
jgi:hypothetical protein